MRALRAQTRHELRTSLRNGEQLLVSLGIPLLVLVFFSLVDVLPASDALLARAPASAGDVELRAVDTLFPRVLALAIMSSAMVALGIGTGFDRDYGVLKRLGATPLGRGRLVGAKILSVTGIQLLQLVVLVAVAAVLGWRPDTLGAAPGAQVALVVAAYVLGTATFAGLGLLLAGTLPGLANLALTNALYLVLLLFGGIAVPLDELPGPMASLGRALPSSALAEVLTSAIALGRAEPTWAWACLAAWALVLPVAAARAFRWD